MKYLHVSNKVENRIEDLKKTGKAGTVVAHKVTRIIQDISAGTIQNHADGLSAYTKYGEKRIKHCRKYDLGCGYRLIMVRRGAKVFITFLGTHDECQRWLEDNSRLKGYVAGKGTLLPISGKKDPAPCRAGDLSIGCEQDDEAEPFLEISDDDLRQVFAGLIEGAKKRS